MLYSFQIPIYGYNNLKSIMEDLSYDELITFNPFYDMDEVSFEIDTRGNSFHHKPFSLLKNEDVFYYHSFNRLFVSQELYAYTSDEEDMYLNKEVIQISNENKKDVINNYIKLLKRHSISSIENNTFAYACIYGYYKNKWYLLIQPAGTLDKEEIEGLSSYFINTHIQFNYNSGDEIKYYQFQETLIEKIKENIPNKNKSEKESYINTGDKYLIEYYQSRIDLIRSKIDYNLISKVLSNTFKYDYLFLFYLTQIFSDFRFDTCQFIDIPFSKITKPNL